MAKPRTIARKVEVRLGSPNQLGPPHVHVSEGAARKAMINYFRGYETFARTRRGAGGTASIARVIEDIGALPFHVAEACTFTAVVDEASGMRIMATARILP